MPRSTETLAILAVLLSSCATGEELKAEPEDGATDAATQGEGSWPSADGSTDSSKDVTQETGQGDGSTSSDGGTCDSSVTINEVQTAGTGGTDDEFVELHNPGNCLAPMDGYVLVYRQGTGTQDELIWTAIAGQTLKGGQYFVLGGKDWGGSPDFPFPQLVQLGASGGGLALKQGATVIDSVAWGAAGNAYAEGSPVAPPAAGKSVGRVPDGKDTDDNAADFKVGVPSPRASNAP